mmetsp:Transcript_7153/g.23291  ORF Transcript_7153/g.23291 Transcript_7153/m.23291 type:complete len:84 (+) Transcript_7153:1073-1324(+)
MRLAPVAARTAFTPAPCRVPKALLCGFCALCSVDTRLVPCGHLFHGRCLRPWLAAAVTAPECPVCQCTIADCALAETHDDADA